MNFGEPWALWLMALLPVVGWQIYRREGRSAVRFSDTRLLDRIDPTVRQRLLWLPPLLLLIAWGVSLFCLSKPRQGIVTRETAVKGLAIEMVLDRSGSMETRDFSVDGKRLSRLAAVRRVASQFIQGDEGVGRSADRIGLITFARHPESVSPLTLEHEFVLARLAQIETVREAAEDRTAIGDALGLAVERLHAWQSPQVEKLNSEKPSDSAEDLAGRVVILLTDGEQNAGELGPLQAAELAAAFGIRVHTIRIGREPNGLRTQHRIGTSEETLRRTAAITGGRFWNAADTDALQQVYAEIDRLETVSLGEKSYTDYRHWAVESLSFGPLGFPPLAAVALVALFLAVTLRTSVLRVTPS